MFSQILMEKEFTISAGSFEYSVDVTTYPAGTYIISIKSAGRDESHLFIKH
jgi:hypothetical protein